MNWTDLLSLKRYKDSAKPLRKEQDAVRLAFEKDFDRIVFSEYFRSLQDKTQVIPFSQTDFVHNRLTHSMEVSVVGRSLGRIVGEQIIKRHKILQQQGYLFSDFGTIVASACLCHDIGNPPFGHSGEKAIGAYFEKGEGKKYEKNLSEKQWQDLIAFEGNAQGFRILTRSHYGTVEKGLNLTSAVLGAFIKYPRESLPSLSQRKIEHICDKKFGIFQSEIEIFKEIVADLGMLSRDVKIFLSFYRHPLAYLVEAADDICYTITDFEDGINLGWIESKFALELLEDLVKPEKKRYSQMSYNKERLSYLRSVLLNRLVQELSQIFIDFEKNILQGKLEAELIKESKHYKDLEKIKNVSKEKIYKHTEVLEKEILGYKIIGDILEVFTDAFIDFQNGKASYYQKSLIQLLPDYCQRKMTDLYEIIMSIVCFVAGMSDGCALNLHKKIYG